MAQRYPTEAIETSSDFLVFNRGEVPTSKNVHEDLLDLLEDTEKIKDLISCRSCHREFDRDGRRPLLLPCLDGICKMCTLSIQAARKTSYECEKCLTKHICIQDDVVTLQIDPTRELLAEIYRLTQEECNMVCEMCPNQKRALHRCIDCSHFICMDCVNLHSTLTPFKSHVVLETKCLLKGRMENLKLLSSTSIKQCPITGHGKESATFFCFNTSCIKPICTRCALTSHKDHNFRDISEVGKESETKVQNQINDLLTKADQACVSITSLTDLHEQYSKMSQELQNEIKIYFSETKRAVERREKKLLDAVSEQLDNEQSCIEKEQRRLTSFVNCCKEACYYGQISSKIDDVQSFLDVSESIQSRFENLKKHVHENQTILKTMKFLKEPPITSHQHVTTVNSLGKLSVSKAVSSHSTAIITPSIIEEQQQVQFEVQLFSSQRKPILDEDVSVCVERNGKFITYIPCVLNKHATTFIGSWIPEEPMQLNWRVVSNGIRMETLEGILDVKQKTQKLSTTITQSGTLEMTTAVGLLIKIYTGSITRLNVDCIVNAANENLMHGGGVAAAISDAAGYQFDQESQMYIADYGPIPVGSCCVTTAGKLPYKHVIHTIGPRWGDYIDKEKCLQDLQKSVMVTFEKADELNMKSIAIPAISSGIFAVPRDMCVEQYYKATMSFSSAHSCQSLKEIHFVDRDVSMVRAIQEVFQQKQSSTSVTATPMSKEQFGALEYCKTTEEIDQFKKPFSKGYTVVTVSNTLQIKIYLGSITDIAADVIVCPQDESCSSDNPIARGIFSMIGGHKPIPGATGHTLIISQTPDKASPWKMIIHAVFPIYDQSYSKDPGRYGSRLSILMKRIIEKAEEGRYTSIAIPLLMEGKDGYIAPVELLALHFNRAVKRTAEEMNSSLKDIYLVLRNEEEEKIYLEFLREKYEITPRPVIQTKTLDSDQSFGKTLRNKPEEEVTCCICMDTPTNPKRLHKCGHIFCKDCIDQCFSYKPACPSCGKIYGKITGDQPPGTLSIRRYQQPLSTFSDSKDCIVLTYSFQHGRQGDEHPNPGTPYEGIQRSGYVPNNEKGRLVAKLLNVAFSRRLVFTIGFSRSTGKDGVITWNNIHHKTRMYGGPEKFGYPDPTYLDRVLEELAAKGVTLESADDPHEYTEYSKQFKW